ncbi:hypothetical protein P5673_022907 [Acropora cervicornis]|uniref:Uncharacterized protein n=1 Tax=Acropora cervicornis TaxID=6130 RepID=A0AAD9UZR2_ACRCE|nr:hypothetical protein P5673_022907 [Acropora cervicornis]
MEHCNRPGRPRLAITQGQLEALQRDSGFRWSDVARILCVSARSLRRRRHELGMLVEDSLNLVHKTREIRNLANSPSEDESMEIEWTLCEASISFRLEFKPRVTGVPTR